MFNPLRNLLMFVLLMAVFAGCKKDDTPKGSDANNSIVEDAPANQRSLTLNINQYVGGYYESIPNHYLETTKKYPLIIFLHGAGQLGDGGRDLPLVLNDGIAKIISEKKFPPNFNIDGNNFSFVVLSPQFRAIPPDAMVLSFLNYALAHYRVDPEKIYFAGISMGGVLTTEMAGQFASRIAAAVSVSGASFGADQSSNAAGIAAGGVPLWAFHNSGDPVTPSSVTTNFVNMVNADSPLVPARATIFQSAVHDAWTKALDPLYKENNQSIYEWMLKFKK